MGLQDQFIKFNKKIKMDYDVRSELADKRDILLKKLRANEDLPSFVEFNQGSYSLYTGVEPVDNEYDIDVGLKFNVSKSDYEPLDLKVMIRDILKNHTEYGAKIKQPCVTVTYKKDDEAAYHVDLVVYAYEDASDKNSQLYLARGKEYSLPENKKWEPADPQGLLDEITNRWSDEKREQYRRVIRYLKRWKNKVFMSDGNNEPPSIGITLLAYEYFKPMKYDFIECKYIYDDLASLTDLVEKIQGRFKFEYSIEDNRYLYTIEYPLPVTPGSNVFYKMSKIQMNTFKEQIDKLHDDLIDVKNEADVVEQCNMLVSILGDDFPVPSVESESTKQKNSIPPSSTAGGLDI